jgi:RNA polymerase primary sigma factor
MKAQVAEVLLTLPPLEELVIRLRYGINAKEQTLDQIAALLGISRDKVRLHEMHGMKKLQHPSRSKPLRVFVPEPAWRTRYRREQAERLAAWRARWAA